jgi:hypothetical protein
VRGIYECADPLLTNKNRRYSLLTDNTDEDAIGLAGKRDVLVDTWLSACS